MSRKNRLTCGDFGGRDSNGEPCVVATADGPCEQHKEQVLSMASEVLNVGVKLMTPPFKRKRDKVCIVGFTSHRDVAVGLDREEWEVWGLNELYRYMPVAGFDRWFEIHDRDYLCADDDGKKHIEDLKTFEIPIYMQKVHKDIPASVKFPVDELCEQLQSKYWTNCPAYMLGFAIALGYEEILMVGVDMAQDTEYAVQRPCCEYWLGYARGKGIKADVAEMSDLLKCVGLYGYKDEGSFLSRKMEERLKFLHDADNMRLKALRMLEHEYVTKRDGYNASITKNEGAIGELSQLRQTDSIKARIATLQEEIAKHRQTLAEMQAEYTEKNTKLSAERNQIVGGIQNTNYIMRSLLPKADNPSGGNIPTREQRAADPQTGIQVPSADSRSPVEEEVLA